MEKLKKEPINILFVCRHNRFRSKFAESYFNKINKKNYIKAKSAGIFPGSFPLDKLESKIAKKLGGQLKGKPQAITTKLLRWKSLIILITDDVKDPENLFNYGKFKNKFIQWKIEDDYGKAEKNIESILKRIMERIDDYYKKLN